MSTIFGCGDWVWTRTLPHTVYSHPLTPGQALVRVHHTILPTHRVHLSCTQTIYTPDMRHSLISPPPTCYGQGHSPSHLTSALAQPAWHLLLNVTLSSPHTGLNSRVQIHTGRAGGITLHNAREQDKLRNSTVDKPMVVTLILEDNL